MVCTCSRVSFDFPSSLLCTALKHLAGRYFVEPDSDSDDEEWEEDCDSCEGGHKGDKKDKMDTA